jgi:putative copper export protein
MITETNYGHIWLLRIVLIALIMGLLYWTHPSRKNKPISELVQSTASSDLESGEPTQEYQATDTNQADDTGKLQEPVEVMPVLSQSSHRVAWLLFAGLLTLLFVLTGPSAQVLQPHFSAILFDWLRNVAQGVWFGSFAYLGYVLLPLLKSKNRDYDAETLVRLQQRLTPVLLVSISIQLLSLIFLSETSIHDPQQLITDPYGVTLLVQLGIIAIAVLLSAYILADGDADPIKRVRTLSRAKALETGPDLSGEDVGTRFSASVGRGGGGLHLQITTGIISMLGIGVLLCSALMSFFAPPIVFPDRTYTNQLDIPTNAVSTQTKQIGPFSVILELLPGRITQSNTVIILIKDSNGQAVTDAQVRLTTEMQAMDMGTSHAVITGGNPVYATTFDLHLAFNMSGFWTINVEIQRPNQQAVQGTFEVMLS